MRRFSFSRPGISPARAALGAFMLALAVHGLLLVTLREAKETASPVRKHAASGTELINSDALSPEGRIAFRHWLDNHDPVRFAVAGSDGDLAPLLAPHCAPAPAEPVTGRFAPPEAAAPRAFVRLALPQNYSRVLTEPVVLRPPEENGEILVQNASGERLDLSVRSEGRGGTGAPSLYRVAKTGGMARIVIVNSCGDAKLDKLGAGQLLGAADDLADGEVVVVHWPRRPGELQ